MEVYLIWLSMIPYVGPILQKRLLQAFQTSEAVYKANEAELLEVKGLGKRAANSICSHRSLKEAGSVLDTLKKTSTHLLTFDSPLYPERAKACPESPVVLYYRGTLHPPQQTTVTIVGTRRCTDYGKQVTTQLATRLAETGIPVMSGMAKGIDGCAHEACLNSRGYTMAFVAGGADICYPSEHQKLYEAIMRQGAVISQYPPQTKPRPKQFIQRNSLMSAWATHVVVTEAGKQSGSLTTAAFAQKHDRKLLAVPHQINHPEGVGTNRLLDGGTPPYLGFDSLQITSQKQDFAPMTRDDETDPKTVSPILSLLEQGPLPFPDLAEKLKLSRVVLQEELFTLELEGKVFTRGGLVMKD